MGLLGKVLSNAVSDGIGKGIQNAVGKAVENAVRPAADKLAGQAADHLNQAARSLEENAEATRTAVESAPASPAGGVAELGSALAGWATAMQGVAGQVAQNMKECPQCGEVVTADHKFCPKCGAQLPDKTLGADYVCPECGKQNLPGTAYCVACGKMLPAAEAENASQLAKWDVMLPQYPKWTLGGMLELEECGETNGERMISLRVGGAGAGQLARYVEMLKADGFAPVYDGDSDVYWKTVDGVCRAFDKTDALQGDSLNVTFFVGDYDKRAAAKEKAEAAMDTAKESARAAADMAKGLFKKLF